MLSIMAILIIILRSERVNTWEFLHPLAKELKVMMILPLKDINSTPDFEHFSILTTKNNFKATLRESLLIIRDNPPLNKDKQSLPLELFDS